MKKIYLDDISPAPPASISKRDTKQKTKSVIKEIEDLQNVLIAQRKYSLLVIMQGMDASGKDSAIKAVFRKISPSGINVQSFKKPTDIELAHDFLWRVHEHTPEKGMIQIFNRSHYEDVLIQRVHHWIDDKTVYERFNHINNFEKLLQGNGTQIIKFYLHIGNDKQLEELNERLTEPDKYYKHNPNDFEERKHWEDYMQCYEDVFENCGPEIPWHIIPANENWYKEFLIAQIIRDALSKLDLQYPNSGK